LVILKFRKNSFAGTIKPGLEKYLSWDTLPDGEPELKGNEDDDHPLEEV
jgi:hypothetical protein